MRFTLLASIGCVLASGCVPVFKLDKDLSCSEDFIPWRGGLTRHVIEGKATGEFSYLNDDPVIDQSEGSYDLATGAFDWWDLYIEASHRERAHYNGDGILFRNGDLDLDYQMEFYYADETKTVYDVRQKRIGCEEEFRIQNRNAEEDLEFIVGTYSAGQFEYSREWIFGSLIAVSTGTLKSDHSYTEIIDFADDPVTLTHLEEGDGQGNATRQFAYDDGFTKLEGTWDQGIEGTLSMDYFVKEGSAKKAFWVYQYDGLRNGAGSWEQDGVTCDLLFELGACKRRQCSDDSNGQCAVPVAAPKF